MDWFTRLSKAQKVVVFVASVFLFGSAAGAMGGTVLGTPAQVDKNTVAIEELTRGLQRVELAVLLNTCELRDMGSEPRTMQQCIADTRRELEGLIR